MNFKLRSAAARVWQLLFQPPLSFNAPATLKLRVASPAYVPLTTRTSSSAFDCAAAVKSA
jgi:hypothetical protein